MTKRKTLGYGKSKKDITMGNPHAYFLNNLKLHGRASETERVLVILNRWLKIQSGQIRDYLIQPFENYVRYGRIKQKDFNIFIR